MMHYNFFEFIRFSCFVIIADGTIDARECDAIRTFNETVMKTNIHHNL